MKKLCIAVVNIKQFLDYGQYIANGTHVKVFDNTKYATIEAAREAKDIQFGITDTPNVSSVELYRNANLPKAYKTKSKRINEGYLVCAKDDIKQVMKNIGTYYNDPDNKEQAFLFSPLIVRIEAYRKYQD